MRIVLALPPNLANARMHWATKHRKRAAYHLLATVALHNQRVPKTPINPARVSATLYVWSRMDDDNAMARLKWAVDALVRHGVLADDKRPACVQTVPEQVVDRQNPRLEVDLLAMVTP